MMRGRALLRAQDSFEFLGGELALFGIDLRIAPGFRLQRFPAGLDRDGDSDARRRGVVLGQRDLYASPRLTAAAVDRHRGNDLPRVSTRGVDGLALLLQVGEHRVVRTIVRSRDRNGGA